METSNNCCIYITKYKRKKCNCNPIFGKKICYKHAKYNNIELFELLNDIFYDNDIELINIQNINKVFDYINTKHENNKKLFIKIIDYLYSVNDLINISINNNIIVKKKSKNDLIINIYSILQNTINIQKYIDLNKLKNFQIKIKNNIFNNYTIDNVTHDKDPFTLDSIDEIPKKFRFYFRDKKLYCFNIKEFEYYLRNNNKNPYTNNIIKKNIIDKLYKQIGKNNIELIKNSEYIWENINQAYTDVVYYMEKIGFYNNILWFIELKYIDIFNIILYYNELSSREDINVLYFETILDVLNENNFHYEFAKETINLFKDGNNHFILCCNYIKSLGKVSKIFEENIPEWLDNTTQTYLNVVNNNFLTILLNNYMSNSNVIYTNIRYNNDNDNDNDRDITLDNYDNNIDNDNIETTTMYYLIDYINRNR
jgi:hypothetical protein